MNYIQEAERKKKKKETAISQVPTTSHNRARLCHFQMWSLPVFPIGREVPSSLLGGVEDVATSDLSLVHHVEDLGQLRETDGLEGSLDQALTVELDGFGGISAVADVGALDGDHSYDRLEDGSLEEGTCGQTDADDGTTRADVLCCVRL